MEISKRYINNNSVHAADSEHSGAHEKKIEFQISRILCA